jgi:hypothetical protein
VQDASTESPLARKIPLRPRPRRRRFLISSHEAVTPAARLCQRRRQGSTPPRRASRRCGGLVPRFPREEGRRVPASKRLLDQPLVVKRGEQHIRVARSSNGRRKGPGTGVGGRPKERFGSGGPVPARLT